MVPSRSKTERLLWLLWKYRSQRSSEEDFLQGVKPKTQAGQGVGRTVMEADTKSESASGDNNLGAASRSEGNELSRLLSPKNFFVDETRSMEEDVFAEAK
ncbi:MAG: hypothetical protein Q9169_007233 [Polycauliona sp. 2 TL-2023]